MSLGYLEKLRDKITNIYKKSEIMLPKPPHLLTMWEDCIILVSVKHFKNEDYRNFNI